MTAVHAVKISVSVERNDIHRRPVVPEKVQIQQQSANSSVSVAERMYGFECVVEPCPKDEDVLSFDVPAFVLLHHLLHLADNFLHSRGYVLRSCDPNVYTSPHSRVLFHPSEDRFV